MKLKLNQLFNKKHSIDQKGRRQKKESKNNEKKPQQEEGGGGSAWWVLTVTLNADHGIKHKPQ